MRCRRSLTASLAKAGIDYLHRGGLGGRRDALPDSPHVALKVDAFRGYADHMASEEFAADYARLDVVAERPTAFLWDVVRVVDGQLVYDGGAMRLG